MEPQVYQKLSPREHVLLRPDTYIGTTRSSNVNRYICNDSFKIVQENVSFCPGLLQLFLEILNNARDRTVVQNEIRCSRIEVNYNPDVPFEFSIMNNGDSILVERHPTENIFNPELIFGHLLTSSNYDDSVRRIVGGRNGFGAKLANIYSSLFTVEVADHRTAKNYTQTWTDNMSVCNEPVVTQLKKIARPYTKITFRFDTTRFPELGSFQDFLKIARKAVVDVAATVSSNVTVLFQGNEVNCSNLTGYLNLFPELDTVTEKIIANVNERWKVAVVVKDGGESFTFVNGMWTTQGGTHENHVITQIVDHVSRTLLSRAKGNDKQLVENARGLQRIIREKFWFFVDACIENPEFTSQTKECLKSPVREFGSTCTFGPAFLKKLGDLSIYEIIMDQLRGKSLQSLKATDGRKVSRILGIDKYDSAQWAGTNKSDQCLLIVTEGDSAKGTAIAGLKARNDRQRFGVFPLRGKILNVRNASASELQANAEFKHLKQILGLQQGKTYESEAERKTLRYGGIIAFTDQDTDGYHIKALLMNIFSTFWPKLLEIGYVRSLPTPIVKISKNRETREFYDLTEFRKWERENVNTSGTWKVKYYKGLGTSTSDEARQYFANFRMVKYTGPEDSTLMEKMFSKDHTDYRKNWIMTSTRSESSVVNPNTITVDSFIHNDYIQHANDNLGRTIPCVIDGLKPSQRKILFGCFHEGLANPNKEMKVAQLGAAVAKVTQYHHGEISLMQSIIGMAQTFVGSNNINLLEPIGQFGTRLMGGKDAASSRYTFTRISEVCKKIFRVEDNPILNYLQEENESIEPNTYVPIIPFVLVNGADGIGTGFSTYIPPSNPKTIIDQVRKLILEEQSNENMDVDVELEFEPYFKNFEGDIINIGQDRYEIRGRLENIDDNTVRITELPVGTWTTPYKAFLDELIQESKIKDYSCTIDDTSVDIRVVLMNQNPVGTGNIFEEELENTRKRKENNNGASNSSKKTRTENSSVDQNSLFNLLKLTTKISTGNIHLFSADVERTTNIRRYTIQEIYHEFFQVRKQAYALRKNHQIQKLEAELVLLNSKIEFIHAKIQGRIVIDNIPIEDIERNIETLQIPRISGSYDYLLDMKLSNFSRQNIEKLEANARKTAENLQALRETSIFDMWTAELLELENLL